MLEAHQNKIYWGSTAIFALAMLGSAMMNLTQNPQILEAYAHLKLPANIALLIGTFKLLGAISLLVPKFPKIKEWAYAGFCFNMLGATYFHLMAGDAILQALTPLFLLIPMLISYRFKPIL
jgi:hypothetical protein